MKSPSRSRSWLLRSGGIVVSLLLVAAIVWWASRQPTPQLPTAAEDVGALLLAIAFYAVATALRAERWRILLEDRDARPTRADAYALTAVGYMGNNVLPARGGDAFRVVLGAARASTGKRTVVGTLLAERLLDIAVLVVLFVVLAITIAGGAGLPETRTLIILGVIGALALVAAGIVALVLVRRGAWERGKEFVAPMLASTIALRGRHGSVMLGLTVLIWAVEASVWGSVGAAANVGMNALEALYIVALASVFSMIPSGPGYVGTQDAAAIIGIKAIGGSSAVALAYLILVRFVLLVPITLVGFILVITRYGGIRSLRAASPA